MNDAISRIEQLLVQDPNNIDLRLDLANLLCSEDDPLGDLIKIQCALKNAPDDKQLRQKEEALLDTYFGELAWVENSDSSLDWFCGFIRSAVLSSDTPHKNIFNLLTKLLSSPTARFLIEMHLGIVEYPRDNQTSCGGTVIFNGYQPIADYISNTVLPPTLQKLFVGKIPWWCDVHRWHIHLGDWTNSWASLSRLRYLAMYGGHLNFESISLPNLQYLAGNWALSKSNIQALSNASWPFLKTLILNIGNINSISSLYPLFQNDLFPRVTHLRLHHVSHCNDLITFLARSNILPQLNQLGLLDNDLDESGVSALLQHADSFGHLKVLDVSGCTLEKNFEIKLLERLPNIKTGLYGIDPRNPDTW